MRITPGDHEKAKRENPEWEQAFKWGVEVVGLEPNHFKVELNSPLYGWVWRAEQALLGGIGNLSAELINLASVGICAGNGCVYCFGAWCNVLDHKDLTSDEKLNSFLREGAESPLLSSMEKDAIEFVFKAQHEPENVTDEDLDRLRVHGLDDADLLNLVHLIDVVSFSNRVNTVFKTTVDEGYKQVLKKYAVHSGTDLAPAFERMDKDIEDRRAMGESIN